MWLTRLALRNPIFILMVSLMVIVLGLVSFNRLSVDLFPDITIPVIRVATFYTGAGPGDIEKTITEPIERAVAATPGIDRVESSSRQGISVVSAWFNYGVNLDNAQFEVSQRVAQILNTLPPGIQQPFVIKFDITNIPIASVAVGAEGLDELQLYDLAYNTIGPQMERIPGVASATVGGGKVREIEVMVQRDALRARGLGILDVVNAVRTTNLLLPSGRLRSGERDYNVFTNTQVEKARPLEEVVVRRGSSDLGSPYAAPIRLADVAKVKDSAADQFEIVRINGERGVFMRVLKQPGANTIAVVDAIRKAIKNLRGVPSNVHLAISFDQSLYIRAAVTSLEHEALWGGLFAILIILIFLASLRATGIIAVAIPLSIIATFMLLYFTGQSLNVFTLGGLALGVGRLVDDSIVELENIHRHLGLGQKRRQAVLAAAQEVAMPILVSTITTIVVFFPVLFLTGVAKSLFIPLALTISFSLLMSFFVSRTVTPLLCLYSLKATPAGDTPRGLAGWVGRLEDRLDRGYAGSLAWVLRHRAFTIVAIFGLFLVSLGLSRFIGSEFFPETDESQFSIMYRAPIGTRVEKTERIAMRLEKAVAETLSPVSGRKGEGRPLFNTLMSDNGIPAGRGALFVPNTGPHSGTLQVNLVPKTERPISDIEAVTRVRERLRNDLPGTQVLFFSGGIVKRILNFGSTAPIDVEILGYDLEQGAVYAKQLLARLRELRDADGEPFLTDLQISREENYPELDVLVDREKAGVLGVTTQDVAQSILTSLVGNTQFAPVPFTDTRTGNEYYINVRLDDPYRSKVADLSEVVLRTPAGKIVTLDTVAQVTRGSGPVLIARKYMQRIIDVTANVAPNKSLGAASDAVQRVVDDLLPPEGFSAQLSGQTQAQKQAFAGLRFAALMALILVYMVLASQFKSLLHPLVIMFSVPLGLTGVFVMLFLTRTTLSVNSFMGIIMMVGIVVSNGVLLVDFANTLRRRGQPIGEAIVQAGRTRLRPILMTTLATIVGLFPMALGIGEGSETNMPLARAVIGGLSVSTFFTLFLVPALYSALDRFSRKSHLPEDDAADLPPGTGSATA
jgi:CzcA family heavy metal efflux pump